MLQSSGQIIAESEHIHGELDDLENISIVDCLNIGYRKGYSPVMKIFHCMLSCDWRIRLVIIPTTASCLVIGWLLSLPQRAVL